MEIKELLDEPSQENRRDRTGSTQIANPPQEDGPKRIDGSRIRRAAAGHQTDREFEPAEDVDS
jgi:hypothetical protein